MKTISKITGDPSVTPEMEQTFENIQSELGAPFVPNFFKVWGDAPDLLNGIMPAMKHILAGGKLDRALKEKMMVAISSLNDCHYCEAAHQAFCMMMGVSEKEVESLKSDQTISDTLNKKEKAAIDFAVKLAKKADSADKNDFENLGSLGYKKAEIMEIIAMSGMAVFYNHLADATKINIDEEFQEKTN